MKKSSTIFILTFSIMLFQTAFAKELPYFDPYRKVFSPIEVREVFRTEHLLFYEDTSNVKRLTIELARDLAQKIEEEFLARYLFLFSFLDQEPLFPIHLIFSERLMKNPKEYRYQAFYSPLYRTEQGFEALLINAAGLGEADLHYFIAHELFHLFYRMKDPAPAAWLEEGLAQIWGSQLTGYIPRYQISEYFQNPSVALEEFSDGSPKYYGHAFLFFYFLKEHYLSLEDFTRLLQVSHPRELFDEQAWNLLLKEFSLAKLLNTVYFHSKGHYALKSIHGHVVPSDGFPTDFSGPRPYLNLYMKGSPENLERVLTVVNQYQETWNVEILYVLTPPYRRITITDDKSLIIESSPYVIVLNFYSLKSVPKK